MMNRAALVHKLDNDFPRTAWFLRRARTDARRIFARDRISAIRRMILANEPWQIDHIALDGGELTVKGWALPPPGDKPLITLNGLPFERVEHVPRPDVGTHFWQRVYADRSGYTVASNLERTRPFSAGFARMAYANAPTRLPFGLARDWNFLDPQLEGAMPSKAQRARVIGNTDEFGFQLSGATDYRRLRAAAEALGGRSLSQFASILDWGVGCGRVARYATREVDARSFTGCDIDRDNVAWCQANLQGSYHHISVDPPLPFPAASFDLLYGVSVFTHLREPLQDAWLAELARVLRPGGLALVTTHGQTALDFAGIEPGAYVALQDAIARKGLHVSSQNNDLDGAVEKPEEYVNVFHSLDYIRRRWSRWLDVVAILPGYIFTHDLVVLRKRA